MWHLGHWIQFWEHKRVQDRATRVEVTRRTGHMRRIGTPRLSSVPYWDHLTNHPSLLLHMMQLGPRVDLKGGRLQLNSLDHLQMECSGGSWWPSSRDAGEVFPPWVPGYSFTSICLPAQRASGLPAPLWKGKFLWLKSCQACLLSDSPSVRLHSQQWLLLGTSQSPTSGSYCI